MSARACATSQKQPRVPTPSRVAVLLFALTVISCGGNVKHMRTCALSCVSWLCARPRAASVAHTYGTRLRTRRVFLARRFVGVCAV